jgi:hypothetical protein
MIDYRYLWKPWTVRTYNILRRNRIIVDSPAEAIKVADNIRLGLIPNAGRKMATELYRAAGLGVRDIYIKLLGEVDIDIIRAWCEYLDSSLHSSLD